MPSAPRLPGRHPAADTWRQGVQNAMLTVASSRYHWAKRPAGVSSAFALPVVSVPGLLELRTASVPETQPGPFIVQGDHGYVEIKSFVVTPLVKK